MASRSLACITPPIGTFSDSRSQATDTASSIADRTFTLIDATHRGISAHELSLRDANRDGQLTGNELASLFTWGDANEDGDAAANEVRSLAQRGIVNTSGGDFL